LAAPGIVPHVRAVWNFRLPDIGVASSPPSSDQVVRDPVLLIETLSPSNDAEMRANIWVYTTIPSVREILAVHSTRMEAEQMVRGADGNCPEMASDVRGDDPITLRSIGFITPLAELYRTTALAR
jgi:Uma2 family endonuclease